MALIGLPDDLGVSLNNGRPGAALGPRAVRGALATYGVANPAGLAWPSVFDAGDVEPAAGLTEAALRETHERVSDAAQWIVQRGLFPIAIGGGHDLTFAFVRGVVRGLREVRGDEAVVSDGIYFDAHLDVRESVGSGMPFRRLIEDGYAARLSAAGINPLVNDRQHTEWFAAHGGVVHGVEGLAAGAESVLSAVAHGGAPLFVSLDMDVFDSAHAPGVSALNPCGTCPREVAPLVSLAGRCERTVCFDIMELCPAHDEQGRTARLAAHMLLAFLEGYSQRSNGA